MATSSSHTDSTGQTPPGGTLDRIVRLAARSLDVPTALLVFAGKDGPCFHACHGIKPDRLAAGHPFFSRTLETSAYVECTDVALLDDAPPFAFCAAAPLAENKAGPQGALCVLSPTPRTPGGDVQRCLSDAAHLVAGALAKRPASLGLFDAVGGPSFTLDASWRFTRINRQAEVLFDRDRSDLIDRNAWDVIPEAIASLFHNGHSDVPETAAKTCFETYYEPRKTWVEVHTHPTDDGCAVFLHDISERVESRRVLKRSAHRYRTFFEAAQDAFIIFTPDDEKILKVNERACRLYDLAREELEGRSLRELTRHVHLSKEKVERILADRQVLNFETVHVRRDGALLHLLVSACVIEYEGRPAILGSFRDITERKEAQQALQEKEEQYRKLVEHADDVIYRCDQYGRFTYVNVRAQRLFKYLEEDLRDINFLDVIRPGHRERERSFYVQQVEQQIANTYREFPAITRDGDELWLGQNVHLMYRGGDFIGFQAVARDITERKQFIEELVEAKEEAEEMARLKSTFLANMSHEIRTPLTAILGFADALVEDTGGETRQVAQVHHQDGPRLLETLNSVLDLAQMEADRMHLRPAPVDVVDIVQATLRLMEPLARENDLTLALDTEADTLSAVIDRSALNRILNNLVGNAIKFTDEGSVTVCLAAADEEFCLHVVDTGIGMSRAFLDELFDEFRQESNGPARSHQGTGLGLTITRGLVDLMDGTIDVGSAPGEGTTFTVKLPRRPPPASSADAAEKEATEERRVLIVEGDPETQVMIEHVLRDQYQAEAAASGLEALARAEDHTFSAVLLDVDRNNDHERLLHALRALPDCDDLPILALTEEAAPDAQDRLLEAGFDELVHKPLTPAQLVQALRRAVDRSGKG